MNDAFRTFAALIFVVIVIQAQGCNGWFSFGGPGLQYSIDGEKHYFKLESEK